MYDSVYSFDIYGGHHGPRQLFTSVYKCKKTTTGLLAQTRLPFDSKKVSSEEERFKRESCVWVVSVLKDQEREKLYKGTAFNDDTRNNSNQHLKRKPPNHDVDLRLYLFHSSLNQIWPVSLLDTVLQRAGTNAGHLIHRASANAGHSFNRAGVNAGHHFFTNVLVSVLLPGAN